jgi:hypothetical protein
MTEKFGLKLLSERIFFKLFISKVIIPSFVDSSADLFVCIEVIVPSPVFCFWLLVVPYYMWTWTVSLLLSPFRIDRHFSGYDLMCLLI